MKTAEQQEDNLLFTIGRLSYCATQNDWKRFEMILRAFTNQIQSDAIESTVRKLTLQLTHPTIDAEYYKWLAEAKKDDFWKNKATFEEFHAIAMWVWGASRMTANSAILSLIPQKEKKV